MKFSPALRRAIAVSFLSLLFTNSVRAQSPTVREMIVDHQWLNFPLSDGAPLHQVEILQDGKTVRFFMAQIDPAHPGWWTSLDLGPWKGAKLQVRIADAAADPTLLSALDQTDEAKELGPELYREPLRPLFHFSARRGWLNDPNGLVFCDGQYHLFFQHNPFSWKNASKHWGHAVSADLVHWREVAEALYPEPAGQMYSGSAVVDRQNLSGLVPDAKTPLVLVYTHAGHGSTQCLASTVDGVTFEKFAGNPVLPPIPGPNRDPKAFWYEPTHTWVLVLYVGTPDPSQPDTPGHFHDRHAVRIYNSANLRDWEQTDVVEGGVGLEDRFLFECPDLYPLPVEGHPGQVKWVLQGGSGEYAIGRFDGKKFTAEGPHLQNLYGGDYYAAQTFNNVPGGRIVQVGWMRAPSPGMPFNQCMSIPLDLALKETPAGLRVAYAPVEELKALRGAPVDVLPGPLKPEDNALSQVQGEGLDIEAELKPGAATSLVFAFRGLNVIYNVAEQTIRCKQFTAPVPLENGVLRLRVLVDRTTLDLFARSGTVYFPVATLPVPSAPGHGLSAVGGAAEIVSLKAYPMRTSWRP